MPGDPDWPSAPVFKSHAVESQYWLSSAQNDDIVKRRIIDGDVEYSVHIWDSISEGEQCFCQWPRPNAIKPFSTTTM